MKQRLIEIIMAAALVLLPALLAISTVYADCGGNGSVGQVLAGIGQSTNDCSGKGVHTAASAAVSILSYIVGIAAIIMIIVSGFRYITSGGDSNRVSSAKNALIYALVGIAVAALAQVLVHFVLSNAGRV